MQKLGQLQLARLVHKPNDAQKQDTNQRWMYVCIYINIRALIAVIFSVLSVSDDTLVEIIEIIVGQKY